VQQKRNLMLIGLADLSAQAPDKKLLTSRPPISAVDANWTRWFQPQTRLNWNQKVADTHWCLQSQCSTLVRNTVVRAILQAYGKWWILAPLGSRNCWTDWDETWHGWLCRWPHPTCTKRKVYAKGGRLGVGVKCSPKACFFSFFFFFWFPERTSSLPGKD